MKLSVCRTFGSELFVDACRPILPCHHHTCTCRLFNGTWVRRVNCDSGESMSVETHCVWSVAPTLDQLSAKECVLLPKDIVETISRKEKCFLVTQYHQFSDDTTQSSHQAFCNFLSLLETHKRRHPWIKKMGRQTDNCYTYECLKVALHMTECEKITGIHVPYVNNNEPGHGGFLADTAGAIMKMALWCWTRSKQIAIKCALMAVKAAEAKPMKCHVPLLVSHDPKQEWELTGSFSQISVTNSLHKVYPTDGGIIFFLYHGLGSGIKYTSDQVVYLG